MYPPFKAHLSAVPVYPPFKALLSAVPVYPPSKAMGACHVIVKAFLLVKFGRTTITPVVNKIILIFKKYQDLNTVLRLMLMHPTSEEL